jgi:hypothetical protein
MRTPKTEEELRAQFIQPYPQEKIEAFVAQWHEWKADPEAYRMKEEKAFHDFHRAARQKEADQWNARIKEQIELGGLYNSSGYIDWEVWQDEVTLDGEFTSQELREIADHMDAHRKPRDP